MNDDPTTVLVTRVLLRDAASIARYLPANYRVLSTRDVERNDRTGNVRTVDVYVIGRDVAGWTATDYVIPRLASGLYACTRVDEDRCSHCGEVARIDAPGSDAVGDLLCVDCARALAWSGDYLAADLVERSRFNVAEVADPAWNATRSVAGDRGWFTPREWKHDPEMDD